MIEYVGPVPMSEWLRLELSNTSRGEHRDFSTLIGKTFSRLEIIKDEAPALFIATQCGQLYGMSDLQQANTIVQIKNSEEELSELIGAKILEAGKTRNNESDADVSITWTYFKLLTDKGYVTITWRGEFSSNDRFANGEVYLWEYCGGGVK